MKPLGGLARKATVLTELQREGREVILVDGGDLFFSAAHLAETPLARQKIKARALVDGYNRMGTAAITIGESDLAGGLAFLQEMAALAEFPILSANLKSADGALLFPPAVTVDKGGLKVALVGVSSRLPDGAGYRFDDPLVALREHLPAAAEGADLVVLLFHGATTDRERIAAAGLPIDLILHSHLKGVAQTLRTGGIPVALLGSEGKRLSVMTIAMRDPQAPLMDITDVRRRINFVRTALNRLGRNQPEGVPLETAYADKPRILQRIAALREQEIQARNALADAGNQLTAGRVDLGPDYRDDPALLAMVNQALAAVSAIEAPVPDGR